MGKGVSVIICFFNARERLSETLQHIAEQKINEEIEWEILMVDNNSTDGAKTIIDEISKRYVAKVSIKYLFEPVAGLSYARMRGINNARYEYLLFCDDDNLLDENYVNISFDMMQQNEKIGMLGGKGIVDPRLILPDWFKSVETAYAVGDQFPVNGNVTTSKGYIWGAGMIMRSTAWREVINNGFRHFLLTGRKSSAKALAGEDTEMCILVQNAGFEIHYSDKLRFIHAIPQARLTWDYYKKICKGFAHAQVFIESYLDYFNTPSSSGYSNTPASAFSKDVKIFLKGALTINFYKILFLEFVRKRSGYNAGFHKRKYFDRIMARILFAKELKKARGIIVGIKKENNVFIA